MKYKLTPFNITSLILILIAIYHAIFPGQYGFGLLGLYYLLPIALFGIFIDFIAQRTLRKYSKIFLLEMGVLVLILSSFAWQKRTKTYIIPDQRDFEFVVTIYDVEVAEKFPKNPVVWAYEREVATHGFLLNANSLDADLPETKIFTVSGVSLQDSNPQGLCFAQVHAASIEVGSKSYAYQAWKIGENGSAVYSSDDINALEVKMKEYLKTEL